MEWNSWEKLPDMDDIKNALKDRLGAKLPEDLPSLVQEEKDLYNWLNKLSELGKATALLEEPIQSQLIFCVQESSDKNQQTFLFPNCCEWLPQLFLQLQICEKKA